MTATADSVVELIVRYRTAIRDMVKLQNDVVLRLNVYIPNNPHEEFVLAALRLSHEINVERCYLDDKLDDIKSFTEDQLRDTGSFGLEDAQDDTEMALVWVEKYLEFLRAKDTESAELIRDWRESAGFNK